MATGTATRETSCTSCDGSTGSAACGACADVRKEALGWLQDLVDAPAPAPTAGRSGR